MLMEKSSTDSDKKYGNDRCFIVEAKPSLLLEFSPKVVTTSIISQLMGTFKTCDYK